MGITLDRMIRIGIDGRKAESGSKKVRDSFGRMSRPIKDGTNALEKFEKSEAKVERRSRNLRSSILALTGGYLSFATAVKAGQEVIAFERQLISVGKTTDIAGAELAALGVNIDNLSRQFGTPTAQLADFARFAGQMGIRGVPQLTKFTETVARLALTLDDLDPNEAAKELAQFLAITGRSDDDIFRVGNAVTKLGNDFRATEDQIIRGSVEIAKSLRAFSVDAETSLALGTTLATLRVRPELAATSMSRTFNRIDRAVREGGRGLNFISEASQIAGEDFARIWNEDKIQGLIIFLEGINRLTKSGVNVQQALEQIGISGDEINRVIPGLASQVDVLAVAFQKADNQINNIPEHLGELQRESDRVLASMDTGIKRVRRTLASGTKALIANFVGDSDDFNRVIEGTIKVMELLVGLDGATDNMTRKTRIIAAIIKGLAIGLTTLVAIKVVSFIAGIILGVTNLTIALATLNLTLSATTKLLLTLVILVSAFSIGRLIGQSNAFRSAFDSVVDTVATGLSFMMVGFSTVIDAARVGWRGFIEFFITIFREAVKGVVGLLDLIIDSPLGGTLMARMGLNPQQIIGARASVDSMALSVRDLGKEVFGQQNFQRGNLASFIRDIEAVSTGSPAAMDEMGAFNPVQELLDNLTKLDQNDLTSVNELGGLTQLVIDSMESLELQGTAAATEAAIAIGLAFNRQISRFETNDIRIPAGVLFAENIIAHDVRMLQERLRLQASMDLIQEEVPDASFSFRDKLNQFLGNDADLESATNLLDKFATSFLGINEQQERFNQLQQEADKIVAFEAMQKFMDFFRGSPPDLGGLGEEMDLFTKNQLTAQERLARTNEQLRIELNLLGSTSREVERAGDVQKFLNQVVKAYARDQQAANVALGNYLAGDGTLYEFLQTFGDRQELVNEKFTEYLVLLDELQRRSRGAGEATAVLAEMMESATDRINNLGDISVTVAESFSDSFESAFMSIIDGTESVSDAFRNMLREISQEILRQQLVQPLANSLGSLLGTSILGFGSSPASIPGANNVVGNAGAAAAGSGVFSMFASGGIVNNPTMFDMQGNNTGVMGEAGPEGIFPLTRDESGNLAISTVGGGGGGTTINVQFNHSDEASFRRSMPQTVESLGRLGRRIPRGAR